MSALAKRTPDPERSIVHCPQCGERSTCHWARPARPRKKYADREELPYIRRRECPACKYRWTTQEVAKTDDQPN